MHLTINGETVSYSLENEQNLGEVVVGVRSWLDACGFAVTALECDGRDLLREPQSAWRGTAISSADRLAVTAERTGDMKIAHWQTVDTWLGMLDGELARTGDAADAASSAARMPAAAAMDPLDELLTGLPQTLEGFAANPFLPPTSDAGKRFAALWTSAPGAPGTAPNAAAIRAWPPERISEAAAVVRDLRSWVRTRITDATHPRETLARGTHQLKESLGGLREVSVLLQTGKDKAAMDILIGFTDAAQSLIDILPFCAPDPARARLLTECTPVLRDLVAAFDSRDSVLIGDLLEYEVAPRIERLMPLLEKAL